MYVAKTLIRKEFEINDVTYQPGTMLLLDIDSDEVHAWYEQARQADYVELLEVLPFIKTPGECNGL